MRRTIALVVFLVFVVGLVLISSDAMSAWFGKGEEQQVANAEEMAGEAEGSKLVYAFDGKEEMAEFEQLYISKQATFGRMGVLQVYFAMEQANLTEIDRQMEERFGFKMDPSLIYDLNRDTMEIKEVGPITAPATALAE